MKVAGSILRSFPRKKRDGTDKFNADQKRRLDDCPSIYRSAVESAYGGKSRASGVKAFCLQCVGYVRKDVTDCTALGCPLHPYRPYQAGDEADAV